PNGTVDSTPVTTAVDGTFAFDYLLVNGVQDTYVGKAIADDGAELAGVMFTDAAPCDATVPSVTFPTIQSAVTALPNSNPGTPCVITILAGTYNESVGIGTAASGKNLGLGVNDSLRYVIQADPNAALGSVIVNAGAPVNKGTTAFGIIKSQFITLKGLTITGAPQTAIATGGGGNANSDLTF